MIEFTREEQDLISRLSSVGGWDDDDAKPIKDKLKPFLLNRACNCCAYCLLSMHNWHRMTIDIEHVLPKGRGQFPHFAFEVRNLSVSCKRCNMGIKRSDTSFYLGEPDLADPFKSEYYEFIHPNLDEANHHLSPLVIQHNTKLLVKYTVVNDSAKGKKTYEYFQLEKLELNSFDEAQGMTTVLPSESLPEDVMQELKRVPDAI